MVHSLAIVSTAFRLTYRVRIRRFWWDDFCAFVALVLDAGLLACLWIQAYVTGSRLPSRVASGSLVLRSRSPGLLGASIPTVPDSFILDDDNSTDVHHNVRS